MRQENGFTLVEALIALVIFSVMAAGFLRYGAQQVQRTQYLADKTVAAVVASNAIIDMQTAGQWPPVGVTDQQVSMAQKEWRVTISVQDTPSPELRRLEIGVGPPLPAQPPLVMLVGFIGKH